jgi:hypothetical protein
MQLLDAKEQDEVPIIDFLRAIKDESVLQEICNYFVNMLSEKDPLVKSKRKINTTELKSLMQQCNKFTFYEFKNRRITYKQFQARVLE